MASLAAKAGRKAKALNELDRLSTLIAKKYKIEVPELRPTSRDPELARILRVEAINDLLGKVLGEEPEAEESAATKEPEEAADLDSMTKAELLEEAEVRGIEIAKSHTKAEIIEAIKSGE